MIRLYNHSDVPDAVLKKCLAWSAREMRVDGDVVVKVTQKNYHNNCSGTMWPGFPYLGHLRGDSYKKRKAAEKRRGMERMIGNRQGWFEISIPATGARSTGAARVLYVMLHEMAHVAQHREGVDSRLHRAEPRNSGRRMNHDKRPIEIDAENRIYDCEQRAGYKQRHARMLAILTGESKEDHAKDNDTTDRAPSA